MPTDTSSQATKGINYNRSLADPDLNIQAVPCQSLRDDNCNALKLQMSLQGP